MFKRLVKFFMCKELISYTLVGLLGTVIDFIAFIVLILYGHSPLVSQWLAGLIGFTHNHLWHHFLVFKHEQKFKKTYTWSMIINVVAIAISGPVLILLNLYIPNIWINKLIILFVFMVIIFIVRKKWIFTCK
ncbi:GtrA family protein [Candidatus Kuenenbacteria bacterium]|nr:GtrA family protein [Candidatus Kuenenbacteria bacterium]